MAGLYDAYRAAIQRQLWAHEASATDSALALEDITLEEFEYTFAAITAGRLVEEALDPSLRSPERREKVALIMGVLTGIELERRRSS